MGRQGYCDGQEIAIEVAMRLVAAGAWDGEGILIVHHPFHVFQRIVPVLPLAGLDRALGVGVYQGVIDVLRPGVDYEVEGGNGEG
ncbi:MAG: hypothetical protein M5R40_29585 [Anaerolineae bacterium]|nr:hypothetical protein [Anaerolineae bacterium]